MSCGASVGPGRDRGTGRAAATARPSWARGSAPASSVVVGASSSVARVGDEVGVGRRQRAVVGAAEGDGVGWADGRAVVGENVGPCVGAAVGAHATVAVEDCA